VGTPVFGPLVIIANSRSTHRRLGAAERVLRDAGLAYKVVLTTGPGHATEAARQALSDGTRYLVAAGGDGTVHEVVNGMLRDDRPVAADAVLGVLPAGSGCDFVRSFGIPRRPAGAARHLTGHAVRKIDVGKVTFGTGEVRYFVNIAEAGLGGSVVAEAARLPAALGGARYFAGFWMALPGFRRCTARLEVDGHESQWKGAINVVVANCQFYGGGMRISPKSDPADGALEVLAMAGPKLVACTTLPQIYLGRHLPHRHIAELEAFRIRIETDLPLPIEADGELLGTTPATFEVLPGAIQLKI
jgi:YegS/Rv2252/BmrU family lipid kinase